MQLRNHLAAARRECIHPMPSSTWMCKLNSRSRARSLFAYTLSALNSSLKRDHARYETSTHCVVLSSTKPARAEHCTLSGDAHHTGVAHDISAPLLTYAQQYSGQHHCHLPHLHSKSWPMVNVADGECSAKKAKSWAQMCIQCVISKLPCQWHAKFLSALHLSRTLQTRAHLRFEMEKCGSTQSISVWSLSKWFKSTNTQNLYLLACKGVPISSSLYSLQFALNMKHLLTLEWKDKWPFFFVGGIRVCARSQSSNLHRLLCLTQRENKTSWYTATEWNFIQFVFKFRFSD